MSTEYSIVLVKQSFHEDSEALGWLNNFNLVLPPKIKEGRYPTAYEMRTILQKLTGYHVSYSVRSNIDRHWRAHVYNSKEGEAIQIWIEVSWYNGDEYSPQNFSFVGDESLIFKIVVQLTLWCGTFILMKDGTPIFLVN